MKNMTTEQARCRRRWMIALFVLTLALTALTPLFSVLTVGGGLRELILTPEVAGLWVIFWPGVFLTDPRCLVVTAALVFCGVVIAQELWRRKRLWSKCTNENDRSE